VKRTMRALTGSAVLAFAVAGCGPALSSSATSAPAAATAPTASAAPSSEGIGQGFEVSGQDGGKYGVVLTKVIDPASPDNEFDAADAGKRLVAAVFSVTGASGTSSDDANLTASLNGSDGQVYQPSFAGIAGYTNFSSGDFRVTAGQTEVGAVAFEVPDGVKVAEIQWTPAGGFGTGATSTWTLGKA
jgi:hypothetical protein